MNKPVTKIVNLANVRVLPENNYQRENTDVGHDYTTIMEQIRSMGRIVKPPVLVEKEDGLHILQGFRRIGGSQRLLTDPTITAELKEALSKCLCIVYKDITPAEELALMFDDGGQKQIGHWGIVNSVWKLDKMFYSEAQIALMMFQSLARFTKNEAKIMTLSTNPKIREEEVKTWFHGTLGNYMLSAAKMGPYVREQFLLTMKAKDGTLAKDEVVRIKMSQARVTALSKAKNSEKDMWTPEEGSPAFNALLDQFAAEDGGAPKEKLSRPDVKELREKADAFFSPLIRKSLLLAAGEKGPKVADLDKDDDEYKRMSANIRKTMDILPELREKNELVANLIGAVINGSASDVQKHFETFVGR